MKELSAIAQMAGPVNYLTLTEAVMWIYDGENWIDEGDQDQGRNSERPRWQDRPMPELQIVPREELERPVVPMPLPVQPAIPRKRERKIGHA